MAAEKNSLSLDLDPGLERRLKTTAALRGMSMVQYCQVAIDKEVVRDEARSVAALPFGHEAIDRLTALRETTFGGIPLAGDSAELMREDREARSSQLTAEWSTPPMNPASATKSTGTS